MRGRLQVKILLLVELTILVVWGASTLVSIQNVKKYALVTQDVLLKTGAGAQQAVGGRDREMSTRIRDQQIRAILMQSAALFGLLALVSFFVVSHFTRVFLTQPIQRLVRAGQQLAVGKLTDTLPTAQQGDELALLGSTFTQIANYFQRVVTVASELATGVVTRDAQVRSEQDALGKALYEIEQYLQQMTAVTARIAHGDFTETPRARSAQDALGQATQVMLAGFRDLLLQIKTRTAEIGSTEMLISALAEREIGIVHDVHQRIAQMASTMADIGKHVEDVARNMETLSSSVEETSASVAQKSIAITQVAFNTRELTQQTHHTIGFLTDATSVLQEIINITETSNRLSQATIQHALGGQQAVEQVMTSMTLIEQTIMTAVDAIAIFARRSREIDTILDVIREITERTSLLALNAAIIAAQAGMHGRGFAVVADEIKNLASGVAGSTKDIAVIVNSLQQDINQVIQPIQTGANDVKHGLERTQQAQKALQTIITSAKQSSSVVIEITAALDELMATSQDVSKAMMQVDVMTTEITGATREQEASTQQINQALAHINEMASQIQHATSHQSTGVQQVIEATHEVLALIDQNLESSRQIVLSTEDLSTQTDLLAQSVHRFNLVSA